ncbi:hypothetical protein J2X81_003316 [Sinomonas atrocyanea]|nr:hypothetical protein [Sinomonas atrocyanea]
MGTFYRGQVNILFGEPESGKTFVALAAIVEALDRGKRAVFLDMDHNGMQAIVSRLIDMGADPAALGNLDLFRYKEPEDRDDLVQTIADLKGWVPSVAVLDSIGELMPTMGLSSNSPDDFTAAHTAVLKPLAKAGAAVIAIDHVAKNPESKAQGPTGTAAKTRAAGGVMLRVTIKDPFIPGKGGSAYLNIKKDRHGGLKAHSPRGDREQLAGTFKLFPDGGFDVFPAADGDQVPTAAPGADLAELKRLTPAPESVRDVKERLGWGTNRATIALKAYRQQCSPFPTQGVQEQEQAGTAQFPVPEAFPGNTEQTGLEF